MHVICQNPTSPLLHMAETLHIEILAVRKGLWEKVSGRLHKPLKVFPYGTNADEVMLFGTVDYELKDGRKANVDWSAHAHLVKQEGKVKMDFYQVYLVSALLQVICGSGAEADGLSRIPQPKIPRNESVSGLGLLNSVRCRVRRKCRCCAKAMFSQCWNQCLRVT